jgi:hypothetical protein
MASWKDGLKADTVAAVEFFFEGVDVHPDEITVTEKPDGGVHVSWKRDQTPVAAS